MSGDRIVNCRIFLGNLASEKTSREELHDIFSRYGRIEEIVMRRSFGFIQFDTNKAAQEAIRGEQGRILGNMKLDINMADNREHKRSHGEDDGGNWRERDRHKERRRSSRSRSPSPERHASARHRRRSRSRSRSPHSRKRPSEASPPHRHAVQVIYRGTNLRDYAESVVRTVRQHGFEVESVLVERRSVEESLNKASERGIRYVIVISPHNEISGTVALNLLHGRRIEGITDILLSYAIEIIYREEGLPPPVASRYHFAMPQQGGMFPPVPPLQPPPLGPNFPVFNNMQSPLMNMPFNPPTNPVFDVASGSSFLPMPDNFAPIPGPNNFVSSPNQMPPQVHGPPLSMGGMSASHIGASAAEQAGTAPQLDLSMLSNLLKTLQSTPSNTATSRRELDAVQMGSVPIGNSLSSFGPPSSTPSENLHTLHSLINKIAPSSSSLQAESQQAGSLLSSPPVGNNSASRFSTAPQPKHQHDMITMGKSPENEKTFINSQPSLKQFNTQDLINQQASLQASVQNLLSHKPLAQPLPGMQTLQLPSEQFAPQNEFYPHLNVQDFDSHQPYHPPFQDDYRDQGSLNSQHGYLPSNFASSTSTSPMNNVPSSNTFLSQMSGPSFHNPMPHGQRPPQQVFDANSGYNAMEQSLPNFDPRTRMSFNPAQSNPGFQKRNQGPPAARSRTQQHPPSRFPPNRY